MGGSPASRPDRTVDALGAPLRHAARRPRSRAGAPDLRGGACGSLYNVCVDPRLGFTCAVRSGVRAPEAAALLDGFFGELRAP